MFGLTAGRRSSAIERAASGRPDFTDVAELPEGYIV
jgi:hypothetical protein